MSNVVTTAALRSLNTQLYAGFLKPFEGSATFYKDVCSLVPSNSASNTYPIRAAFPQMREWTGERVYNDVAVHSHVISNKRYELTMSVNADDVRDHSYGAALLDVASLGERAAQHPDLLVATLMSNGHALLCYDGQNFFDTDHPIDVKAGTGTQLNYSASGVALTTANWELVRGRMADFRDDKNEPIGVRPNLLVVPPQLEGTARRILEAETEGNNTNVNKGTAKVLVVERLAAAATTWYALDTRMAFKPFIFQLNDPAKFTMMTDVRDDNVFRFNRFDYGVDGRWAAGLGAWFRAYKAVA